MTSEDYLLVFWREIRLMAVGAYPNARSAIESLGLRTSDMAQNIAETALVHGLAYEVFSHKVILTPDYAGQISFYRKFNDSASEDFVDIHWRLLHEVLHGASFREIQTFPDGRTIVRTGVSEMEAKVHFDTVVKSPTKRDCLNEALTNYYAYIATRRANPALAEGMLRYFENIGASVDIPMSEKLVSIAGPLAIELAYFHGRLGPLRKGLQKKSINPSKFLDLLGDRRVPNQDNNFYQAVAMIGLSVARRV